jgi:hypothetical protein
MRDSRADLSPSEWETFVPPICRLEIPDGGTGTLNSGDETQDAGTF